MMGMQVIKPHWNAIQHYLVKLKIGISSDTAVLLWQNTRLCAPEVMSIDVQSTNVCNSRKRKTTRGNR